MNQTGRGKRRHKTLKKKENQDEHTDTRISAASASEMLLHQLWIGTAVSANGSAVPQDRDGAGDHCEPQLQLLVSRCHPLFELVVLIGAITARCASYLCDGCCS